MEDACAIIAWATNSHGHMLPSLQRYWLSRPYSWEFYAFRHSKQYKAKDMREEGSVGFECTANINFVVAFVLT